MGLNKKMSQIMSCVGSVPMNGKNTFHNYKYVTEADILNTMRPLLVEHDITLHVSCVDREKEGEFTRVLMEFTLVDNESGEEQVSRFWGEGQDKGDKGYYKAYTGAQKYFFMKTFMLATGDDPEKDTPTSPRQPNRRDDSKKTQGSQPTPPPSSLPKAILVDRKLKQDAEGNFSYAVKLATVEEGEEIVAIATKKEVLSLLKTSSVSDVFFFKVKDGELIELKLAHKAA